MLWSISLQFQSIKIALVKIGAGTATHDVDYIYISRWWPFTGWRIRRAKAKIIKLQYLIDSESGRVDENSGSFGRQTGHLV